MPQTKRQRACLKTRIDVLARGPLEALVNDRHRLGGSAQGDQADGQIDHAHERVGVVGAELDLPQGHCLFAELLGVAVPAEVVVAAGQVVHAHQRVGVVRAELGFRKRQRHFAELEGVRVPAEGSIGVGEVREHVERVEVVGAQLGFHEHQRLFARA